MSKLVLVDVLGPLLTRQLAKRREKVTLPVFLFFRIPLAYYLDSLIGNFDGALFARTRFELICNMTVINRQHGSCPQPVKARQGKQCSGLHFYVQYACFLKGWNQVFHARNSFSYRAILPCVKIRGGRRHADMIIPYF